MPPTQWSDRVSVAETPPTENPFAPWVSKYYDDPIGFAKDMLGVDLYDYQKAPLVSIAGGARQVAVTSGHGTGKSTDAAIAMLWFLLTRFPCRVVCTAPTLKQLDSVLMASVRNYILVLPQALQNLLEVQRDTIFLHSAPDDAWIQARTARAENPEALAGIHAPHVLMVVDEASGVPEAIYEHAVGSMSGDNACTFLLSNPTRRSGLFYKVFNDAIIGESWVKYRFSCRTSELVSAEFIRQVEETYGKESNQVRVRVDGLFPTEDLDTFMPGTVVEDAITRNIEISVDAPATLGVDVARMGADRTAICLRREKVVEEVKAWSKKDLMDTVGRIVDYIATMAPERRPVEVCVDAIGLGAGVADRLIEVFTERGWNITVWSVNVSEAATVDERAHKLKDELWLRAKDWLELRDCSLPSDASDLVEDLVAPSYKFTSAGKIQIESKEEMKRRGKKSTDLADSFVLTFAGHAASILTGNRKSWKVALKRNLKGIA